MAIKKWLGHQFKGSCRTDNYRLFEEDARSDLSRMASENGMELYAFIRGDYCFDAALKKQGSQQCLYISIPDVRCLQDGWYTDVLYLKAKAEEAGNDVSKPFPMAGWPTMRCSWPDIGKLADMPSV